MNVSLTYPGRAVLNKEYLSILSHAVTSITLQPLKMTLIEVEDTLFHLDSAVMLPSNPRGTSSNQGSGGSAEQKAVSGLAILALLFRELELYPDRKFIIAAHTDTSGDDALNFKLSELRAKNVLHLLDGNNSEWAEISADRHRIEDYQQIMQFFALKKGWTCDPVDIDNKWGDKTEKATKEFLDNTMGAAADDTLLKIKNDPKKKWPQELWLKVFDLYMEELDNELQETSDRRIKRQQTVSSRFADPSRPYLACGESYPIDGKEKDNYRSQTNRRVEFLMFDGKDVPTFNCPADTVKKHDIANCPVWNKWYIKPEYIDPQDINAVMYYLRFVYYDRIKKDLSIVPDGLVFQAYEYNASILKTFTGFNNDTYAVKVRFKNKIKDPVRTKFYFEFTTNNKWIYTKDASAAPIIVTKTDAEMALLTPDEQWKHQTLPKRWCSHEYWTRFEGIDGGVVTFADVKQNSDSRALGREVFAPAALRPAVFGMPDLKPFGDDVLAQSKPLVFSLDDCILTDSAFNPMAVVADDAALLDREFSVINPITGSHEYLTTGGLSSNHIPFRYYSDRILRAIVYKNRMHCIFHDHVNKDDFAGQRAVVFNHPSNSVMITGFQQRHYREGNNIGNFDAYLFRNIDFVNNESVSYIINYFRWHLEDATSANPSPQAWINETCKNIVDEWNDAAIGQLPALTGADGDKKYRIFIRYFLQNVPKPFQHTLVKVHPAGTDGRSFMGMTESEIRADENRRNPSSKEFVAAHEFGHASSLDDNYHEKWENCCYSQRGFVDFKPGAPFDYDDEAMMNEGKVIRSRDYWQFAEWMYVEFATPKAIKFRVNRKGVPDYELPYNAANTGDQRITGNESRSYYNYPDKLDRLKNNSRSGKGKFDSHVYPLGKDPYSEGKLASTEKFTGLAVLTVNLRFQFWDSADYEDISDYLSSIELSINENLLNSLKLKITGNAPPYTNICIKIQPRYLVNNYTEDYKILNEDLNTKANYDTRVAEIAAKPEAVTHYTINVTAPLFGTVFSNTEWTDANTLELVKGDRNRFWRYFCQMLGLAYGEKPTATNFELSGLIPGGTIQSY